MPTTTATERAIAPMPVRGLPDPGERVPRLAKPTVALWFATAALFAIEAYGVLGAGWQAWVTIPMGVAVTFLMFTVVHEATHHAISTNTRVNDLFGHLAMPFVLAYTSFPLAKFIHIEHHRNTNESLASDPDAWTDHGPWWQLPFRWATIDVWYLVFWLKRIKQRPSNEIVATVAIVAVFAAAVAWAISVTGCEVPLASSVRLS